MRRGERVVEKVRKRVRGIHEKHREVPAKGFEDDVGRGRAPAGLVAKRRASGDCPG